MRRAGANSIEVRTKIARAAEELFAARGYSGTSVRDVASRAGVTGAMIHYYFGSKEKLYRYILQGAVRSVRSVIESARSSESCEKRIRRFVEAYARFVFSHANLVSMLNRELLSGGKRLRSAAEREGLRTNYEMLRRIIADGVRSGELRPLDLDLAPVSLIGMILMFQIGRPLVSVALGAGHYDERFISQLAAHTTGLFFEGAKAGSKKRHGARTTPGSRRRRASKTG
ncbi:MAG TPA: TetR family transcriptional regulator [Blastocatellia bacterium]|nr:TetR family transcriptional regulator [Blastocatellia bacterium]